MKSYGYVRQSKNATVVMSRKVGMKVVGVKDGGENTEQLQKAHNLRRVLMWAQWRRKKDQVTGFAANHLGGLVTAQCCVHLKLVGYLMSGVFITMT